jgi:hypothetical protein
MNIPAAVISNELLERRGRQARLSANWPVCRLHGKTPVATGGVPTDET